MTFGLFTHIHFTMITTYGIQPGGYADDIQSQVTMREVN